jgi:2-iminobutanoate/2-iminopropanoate deaminase
MAIKRNNPAGVHQPGSKYVHAVSIPAAARRVVISGQVGVRPDGTLVRDLEGQIAQIIANIDAILKSEGLRPENIVKLRTYVVDRAALPIWRTHRDKFMAGTLPASTLVFVSGLVDPDMKIEVEVEAVAA